MSSKTFSEDVESYAADVIEGDRERHAARSRRDFAAGFLAALKNNGERGKLLQEVLEYARTIGRDVENAR